MLNGNEKIEEQAIWLDRILTDNPQRWTIAGIHQPVFQRLNTGTSQPCEINWFPFLTSIPLISYCKGMTTRTLVLIRSRAAIRAGDRAKGTIYVISVSGPKFYKAETQHEGLMARVDAGRQLFQVIRVDGNRLFYESFDVKGELFDSFTLEK
jgi:acid phosphatase type 7